MLTILHFAAVPASLLLLIATHARSTLNDPLPRAYQHIPSVNPEAHFETKAQLHRPRNKWTAEGKPVAVLRMSDDEGEMFFPQYWQFQPEIQDTKDARRLRSRDSSLALVRDSYISNELTNASIPQPLQAPFSLHRADAERPSNLRATTPSSLPCPETRLPLSHRYIGLRFHQSPR